ncbi:MAG TPA: DUF456 domain-containing protein [Anaerolineae bacterium]|nr:DUF456 domain-containing protein [Anaerolineae bacterium]
MATAARLLAFLLMFAGLVGTLLPVMPDTLLVLGGAVMLLLADGLASSDLKLLALLALIAVVAEGLGYAAGLLGAKTGGASWKGMAGAVLGGLVGLFVLQPFGIFVGPLVGAVMGEMWAGKQTDAAVKAGFGALVGVLGGVVLKLAAAATMIGLVVLSILAG